MIVVCCVYVVCVCLLIYLLLFVFFGVSWVGLGGWLCRLFCGLTVGLCIGVGVCWWLVWLVRVLSGWVLWWCSDWGGILVCWSLPGLGGSVWFVRWGGCVLRS